MKTTMNSFFTFGVIIFLAVSVKAQDKAPIPVDKQATQAVQAISPGQFTDSDKDGICDNRESKQVTGQGRNFIDKNSDGICDNRPGYKAGKDKGNCCGYGQRHAGKGNCCGYRQGCYKGNGQGFQHRYGRCNGSVAPASPAGK